MDFREFATNYLNPVFLLYRAVILAGSGFIFMMTMVSMNNATRVEFFSVMVLATVMVVVAINFLKSRPLILYFIIPLFLGSFATTADGQTGSVRNISFYLTIATGFASAGLLLVNGFRSWGYGVSVNDLKKRFE